MREGKSISLSKADKNKLIERYRYTASLAKDLIPQVQYLSFQYNSRIFSERYPGIPYFYIPRPEIPSPKSYPVDLEKSADLYFKVFMDFTCDPR